MQIDLQTKIIPKDMKVWVVHSGRQKKFRKNFAEMNRVFIDFPGLPFYADDLPKDEREIYRAIYESQALKRVYRGVSSNTDSIHLPRAIPKNQQMMLSYVKRFYKEIAVGDMVISPARRQYDRLLIGIVKSDVNRKSRIRVDDYIKHYLPAREVSWLNIPVTKRDLDDELAIRMENPQAIIKLTGKDHLDSLFSEMYGSYIWGDESKVDIDCSRYRGKNPLELIPVQKLLAFFNAAYYCYAQGELEALKGKTFEQIIQDYFDDSFILDIGQEFHSAGYYRQKSKRVILTLVLVCGITLAANESFTEEAINKLKITNSTSQIDSNDEKELKKILKGISGAIVPKTQAEINAEGKKGKEELNMSTHAKLNQ